MPHIAGMKVISSDATDARFVALGLNKAVVIDLPTDIKDVLVADELSLNLGDVKGQAAAV